MNCSSLALWSETSRYRLTFHGFFRVTLQVPSDRISTVTNLPLPLVHLAVVVSSAIRVTAPLPVTGNPLSSQGENTLRNCAVCPASMDRCP